MSYTFKTEDFEIYFFDRNDTGIENVRQITVEELYKENKNSQEEICFISSANSLLFMDGGSDLGYMNCIDNIESSAKKGGIILNDKTLLGRPHLNIGNTMAFKLNKNVNFISAPTMFLPQKVNGTDNQYYALKSALYLCKLINVKKVYCPMMCTSWGNYTFNDSFQLMKKAVEDYKNFKGTQICKEGYFFNIVDEETRKIILSKQPVNYMNTEFGVVLEYTKEFGSLL